MKFTTIVTLSILGSIIGVKGAIFDLNNLVLGPADVSHPGDFLYADENGVLLDSPTFESGLPNDNIITMGYFPDAFDVIANLNNIPFLLTNYTIANSTSIPPNPASTAVGLNSPSLAGQFPGYVEIAGTPGEIIGPGNPLIGRPLYSFVGNRITLADSTSFALTTAGSLRVDDNPVFQESYSSDPIGRDILIGNVSTRVGDFGGGFGTYNVIGLVPIPEPSVTLLSGLGVLGLLRRRR